MSKRNKISNSASKAMNTLSAISTVTGNIVSVGNAYNSRKQSKESGELERIKQQIIIYDKKSTRLIKCCLVLWSVLIIGTVILCISGNDIVLSFLHL